MLSHLIERYEAGCEEAGLTLRQAMIALSESIYDWQFDYNFNHDCTIDTDDYKAYK